MNFIVKIDYLKEKCENTISIDTTEIKRISERPATKLLFIYYSHNAYHKLEFATEEEYEDAINRLTDAWKRAKMANEPKLYSVMERDKEEHLFQLLLKDVLHVEIKTGVHSDEGFLVISFIYPRENYVVPVLPKDGKDIEAIINADLKYIHGL